MGLLDGVIQNYLSPENVQGYLNMALSEVFELLDKLEAKELQDKLKFRYKNKLIEIDFHIKIVEELN